MSTFRLRNTFCLAGALTVASFSPLMAQNSPAVIAGDFADPSIIKVKKQYYATGTSSEWAPHYPIFTSSNLKDWKQTGYVFDKAPEWTSGSFWAPEYYYHNNTYYIYYTARRKSDNISCIGVATSKYPDRGFKDHGVIVSHGKEAIDAFVYNDNGQLYMTYKAYGLDKRPIELLGSKLSADGLKLEGEVFSMLKDEQRMGMEGQSILKQGEYYYLFYSAGNCCGNGCDYNVRVARSEKFEGPYENYAQNPILSANGAWKCTGHGTFVKQDNGKYLYMYHGYNKENNVFTGREGLLAELNWGNDGWPSFTPLPAAKATAPLIQTSFRSKYLESYWQWDFRNATPVISLKNEGLTLSGTVKESNQTGIALTVRPVSNHFDITTIVTNTNNALKGLVFYGDANAAVGVGVTGNTVEFWMVKGNKRSVIASQTVEGGTPVRLKFSMLPDKTCAVFYGTKKTDWIPLGADTKQDISFLPQWDRSPRAGLFVKGTPDEQAQFAAFELTNK